MCSAEQGGVWGVSRHRVIQTDLLGVQTEFEGRIGTAWKTLLFLRTWVLSAWGTKVASVTPAHRSSDSGG